MPENPNPYDDDSYLTYQSMVDSGVGGLWESGASVDDIMDIVRNTLANCQADPNDDDV